MPPHVAFFWGMVAFLLGVLLKSFFSGTVVILAFAGIFISLLFSRYLLIRSNKQIAREKEIRNSTYYFLLSTFLIFGAFYYHFYDTRTRPTAIPYRIETAVQGRVIQTESRLAVQIVTVKAREPLEGKVRATIGPSPTLRYGDEVILSGTLERPETGSYERYLKKDNIFAVMSFPHVMRNDAEQTRNNTENPIQQFHVIVVWENFKRLLYSVSDRAQEAFARILPAREAALMSGLTLGDTSQFTKEFKEAMQRTGTTHIVALSGYNVMVIVSAVLSLLSYCMSRRKARWVALLIIAVFVLLTGAAASVVRAGIMAFLLMYLTAGGRMPARTGRRNTKNIAAATALAMVLINPRVLAFDVGFQLSFLAFLGIAYVAPSIEGKLKKRDERKVGIFRRALAYTLSAQLMTLPLLVGYFDRVFLSSVVPNVLVVALVPWTMALGFLSALLSFFFPLSSYFAGWLAYPLLRLMTFIIESFSRAAFLPISAKIGIIGTAGYYIALWRFFANNKKDVRHPA